MGKGGRNSGRSFLPNCWYSTDCGQERGRRGGIPATARTWNESRSRRSRTLLAPAAGRLQPSLTRRKFHFLAVRGGQLLGRADHCRAGPMTARPISRLWRPRRAEPPNGLLATRRGACSPLIGRPVRRHRPGAECATEPILRIHSKAAAAAPVAAVPAAATVTAVAAGASGASARGESDTLDTLDTPGPLA